METFTEELWVSPKNAKLELINRGYDPSRFSTISSSHEEVALSLIVQSGQSHDILGLVKLLRDVERVDDRGEV